MADQTTVIVNPNWSAVVKGNSFGSFAVGHDLWSERFVPEDVNHVRLPIRRSIPEICWIKGGLFVGILQRGGLSPG